MHHEPNLDALRALTFVAEGKSISAAAKRLGISQQAVSLRIRDLEKDLRVQLLVRTARGSRLTPSGELVVGWARTLLAAADDYSDAVAALRSNRGKTIHIAASLTIAEYLLPQWIARWRVTVGDDGPVVQLAASNSAMVIDSVRNGMAELGFIETPTIPPDLGSVTIAHDAIDVVVAPDHKWARSGRVSLREFAETRLILRETGSGTRQALEDALAASAFPLAAEPAAIESTTLGVRSAIMAGVAPGALSSLAVSDDIRAGRLVRVRVTGFENARPLTAVWTGKAPPREVRQFLEIAQH